MKTQLRKDSKRQSPNEQKTTDSAWCREEFKSIDFGDKRLNKRFVKTATMLSDQPLSTINQACPTWHDSKAAYRMFDNDRCTADEIRRSHIDSTLERIHNHPRVLVIQDSTTFNFNGHPATEGLGPIGKRASPREPSQGLWMHSALAVLPHTSSEKRDGVPLGLLDQKIWSRQKEKKTRKPTGLPIETKESFKWLESLQSTVAQEVPGTEFVTVCDREGDIFEFLHLAQDLGAKFLVRNNGDRKLWPELRWAPKVDGRCGVKAGNTLRNSLKEEPLATTLSIKVARKAGLYPDRQAKVEVRYGEIDLHPPTWPAELTSIRERLNPVRVHAVWIKEIDAPKDIVDPDPEMLEAQRKKSPRRRKLTKGENPVAPVEWLLLTNVWVNSLEDALERVSWYEQRWQIEVFHKVLKSGCAVERCRLESAGRLEKFLALSSVIAWRIHWMSLMGRADRLIPADCFLSKDEWQALYCKIKRTSDVPKEIPSMYQAIRWIAQLGGFLARKSDGEPGTTTLWRGWQRLHDITEDWMIFRGYTCG